MAEAAIQRRIWQLFAEILSYPHANLKSPTRPLTVAVRECEALLAPYAPEAAAWLGEFGDFTKETPPGRLEEIYSSTFDLDPSCHPYVGYHLLGESYKRSLFLVRLKECYRAHGFGEPPGELPDHLAIMLRFLAVCDDPVLTGELVHEALLPALERMTRKQSRDKEPVDADPPFPRLEGTGAPMPAMPEEATFTPPAPEKGRSYLKVLQALHLTLAVLAPPGQKANEANGNDPKAQGIGLAADG